MAIGLGRRLNSRGFKVRYTPAASLATELVENHKDRTLRQLEKILLNVDLLILDELSLCELHLISGRTAFSNPFGKKRTRKFDQYCQS
jgi:DNA replication protein DnaC